MQSHFPAKNNNNNNNNNNNKNTNALLDKKNYTVSIVPVFGVAVAAAAVCLLAFSAAVQDALLGEFQRTLLDFQEFQQEG